MKTARPRLYPKPVDSVGGGLFNERAALEELYRRLSARISSDCDSRRVAGSK